MLAEVALQLPLHHTFTYRIPQNLEPQIQVGHSVLVPFRSRSLSGIVTEIQTDGSAVPKGIKDISALIHPSSKVSGIHLALTRWISKTYACGWGEALASLSPGMKRLKRAGRPLLPGTDEAPSPASVPFTLTDEQFAAADIVKEAIRKLQSRVFLIFGVTSSGKTEVYLKAVREVVDAQGRAALFLVPEISLCRPFYDILRARHGAKVGLWHSQMPLKERIATVEGIRKGEIKIVLGARSALFSPLENLGLIILDEEHDFSYKQEEKPRYHAREAALELARLHGACVILGSATPSIESFQKAREGHYKLLKLTQRVPGHSVPEAVLVDRKKSGKIAPLTTELIEAIRHALSRREQVILALNRRGFSTFLVCMGCGAVAQCPDCRITLVHHREEDGDFLRCHFCFYNSRIFERCKECGSSSLNLGGFGTQKIVQEVKRHFPFARIIRLDRDAARKKNAMAQAYHAFRSEDADIWVGTQMATQGFDFPRVTLVGIVDADTALHHPDFRAAERTFQWVTQAAGRAGRSAAGGKVVVQTALPENEALAAACLYDYEGFFESEAKTRRRLLFPPFSRLALLRVQSAQNKDIVPDESDRLAEALRACPALKGAHILGPGPSFREHLQKQSRWQILVKCLNPGHLEGVLAAAHDFEPKAGIRLVIDVDPYDVL